MNGGTCSISDGVRYCHCPSGFGGFNCKDVKKIDDTASQNEASQDQIQKDTNRGVLVPVISAVAVIIAILAAFLAFDYFYKRRQSFSHERLQENDFNNPMYQDRDAEPFTLDADKVR